MLGIPLKKWNMYSEPVHAAVYTPERLPRHPAGHRDAPWRWALDMVNSMLEIRENPRPGIVNGLLQMRIDGVPARDMEILGNLAWSSAAVSTPRPR